ncbi:MAG TPA: hypothetical protein VF292_03080 [Rhodanobacteraceae bacterium]
MNTPVDLGAVPWLHLYAQPVYHDEAYVVGTRTGLLTLRHAIDAALADDAHATATAECFVGDGEGYALRVAVVSQATVPHLAVPYTDSLAVEQRKSALWPVDLFT